MPKESDKLVRVNKAPFDSIKDDKQPDEKSKNNKKEVLLVEKSKYENIIRTQIEQNQYLNADVMEEFIRIVNENTPFKMQSTFFLLQKYK